MGLHLDKRGWAALLLAAAAAHAADGERILPVGPERTWQAVVAQPEVAADSADRRRFTASARQGDQAWRVDVDWDERSGGTRLRMAPDGPAAQAWADRVAAAAESLPQVNRYCRGEHPDLSVPEPSIDAAHSCDPGNFSSAIHELEKCGDHETTLRLLAMCVRSGHAAGLIRIAQLYETGIGVPQRPERAVQFLALGAASGTPGYSRSAKVLWATALYFGDGAAVNRPRALALFREAAAEGDPDARQFLAAGWHAASRRTDGTLYRDPSFVAAGP